MKRLARTRAFRRLRRNWPYVLVELLVPGGTVIAFLLWLSSGQAKGQFAELQPVPDSQTAQERVVAPAASGVPPLTTFAPHAIAINPIWDTAVS